MEASIDVHQSWIAARDCMSGLFNVLKCQGPISIAYGTGRDVLALGANCGLRKASVRRPKLGPPMLLAFLFVRYARIARRHTT